MALNLPPITGNAELDKWAYELYQELQFQLYGASGSSSDGSGGYKGLVGFGLDTDMGDLEIDTEEIATQGALVAATRVYFVANATEFADVPSVDSTRMFVTASFTADSVTYDSETFYVYNGDSSVWENVGTQQGITDLLNAKADVSYVDSEIASVTLINGYGIDKDNLTWSVDTDVIADTEWVETYVSDNSETAGYGLQKDGLEFIVDTENSIASRSYVDGLTQTYFAGNATEFADVPQTQGTKMFTTAAFTASGTNFVNGGNYIYDGTTWQNLGNDAALSAVLDTKANITYVDNNFIKNTYVKVNTTGVETVNTGADAVAIGAEAHADSQYAVVAGYRAGGVNATDSTGERAVCIGYESQANGSNGVSVGPGAKSTGDSGLALGRFCIASGDNSVAIGRSTMATANGQVSFRGGSVNMVTFPTIDGEPTGAPNGSVYYDTGTNKLRLRAGGAWVDLN